MRTGIEYSMIVASAGLRPYLEIKLGTKLGHDAQFVGRLRSDGSIWGVVGFNNFSEYDCEMFMAGESGWISRKLMKAAFAYPFNKLGLQRVSGRVESTDTKTLDIDKRLGFKVEGCLRHALGNNDIIIIGMLRSECRWI
jgi:RimJ/RimL family protein N-acetyltransferase